jgi:hypothetical protein
MWNRTRPISGLRRSDAARALAAFALALLAGCNYTFQAGSGFPPHVQTLAVIPFENETDRFEISQELHQLLLDELPRTFGVRTGSEEFAEAVVRGTIRQYVVQADSYRPEATGDRTQVITRQVSVSVEVQVIDLVNDLVLWESPSLSAIGEYLEASETEEEGRRLALTRVVQDIINGLQSNW